MHFLARRQVARKKPIEHRFIWTAAICGAVQLSAPARSGAQELDELAATKTICEAGPAARVARAERLAGAAAIRVAGLRPNPALYMQYQPTVTGVTSHEVIVGVQFPLSVNGRRGLMIDAARARSEQAKAAATSTLFESALEFRQAYASAMADRARVEVLIEQQALLDAMSTTVAALEKGGEAAQVDVLRQRVHARLHRRTLATASARAQASLAWIEAWLGTNVTLPATPLRALGAGNASTVDPSTQHPELQALQASARASALEAQAALRRWFPDLQLFGGYRVTTGSGPAGHGLSLSLTAPLTFFDHGQGEAAVADATKVSATASQERLRLRYDAQLKAAVDKLASLADAAADLEASVTEARELMDKTRQMYMAGEANLTELLDAFRSVEEARLGSIDVDAAIVEARLARMQAAGTQLDETLDKLCSGREEVAP